MKLNEIAKYQHLTTKDKIAEWLNTFNANRLKIIAGEYQINDDLTVDVDGDVRIMGERDLTIYMSVLPIKFGNIYGNFWVHHTTLTNMKGFPKYVKNGFSVSDNMYLRSLQFCPKEAERIYIWNTGINSLHNIHKHIHSMEELECNDNCTNILGLLFIKNLKRVNIGIKIINSIINKYFEEPAGQRDIHSCQEELLEAGFVEQAKF